MKIAIGYDPNAAPLKGEVIAEVIDLGHEIQDYGGDDPIYANVVIEVSEAVVRGDVDRGIVLCGTGIGASIAANKVRGAYCALVTSHYQAERSALSNDVNLIALGQHVLGSMVARDIVRTWLSYTGRFDPASRSGPKVRRIIEYAESRGT